MTEVLEIQTSDEQRPERAVAIRRFDAKIEAGDGRTISFRIAPFGEIATCADGLGGLPKGVPYQEELMPGLYDGQLRAANRVLLNFEHQEGIGGIVGHGLELWKGLDGYHASFRIHETADGDKTLTLVREDVLRGASVESYWLKSVRSAKGIVQRFKAHLDAVAICRQGAYAGAVMTGLRTDELPNEFILDEELLPISLAPDVAARVAALGIAIPDHLKAHPAEDTPTDVGTPETAPATTETEITPTT